jgi:hypothetical protein
MHEVATCWRPSPSVGWQGGAWARGYEVVAQIWSMRRGECAVAARELGSEARARRGVHREPRAANLSSQAQILGGTKVVCGGACLPSLKQRDADAGDQASSVRLAKCCSEELRWFLTSGGAPSSSCRHAAW